MGANIFTPRELEILRLQVVERLTEEEVAEILKVSGSTVKATRHRMLAKLKQRLGYQDEMRFLDLAIYAMVHNLIDVPTLADRYSAVCLTA
jgi:DNA-binding NarL/FixJ family response regulator